MQNTNMDSLYTLIFIIAIIIYIFYKSISNYYKECRKDNRKKNNNPTNYDKDKYNNRKNNREKTYNPKKTYNPNVYNDDDDDDKDKLNNSKGEFGEYLLVSELKSLGLDEYFIFRNLYIPNGKNHTNEIDVLLLHETGIYCFECKNFSGSIFGKKNEDYWTEYYYKVKRSYQFYNPIKQNRKHIETLKRLDSLSSLKVYNCIIFIKDVKLPSIEFDIDEGFLSPLSNLTFNLNRIMNYNPKIYSREDLEIIKEKLNRYQNVSEEIKKRHIHNSNSNKKR